MSTQQAKGANSNSQTQPQPQAKEAKPQAQPQAAGPKSQAQAQPQATGPKSQAQPQATGPKSQGKGAKSQSQPQEKKQQPQPQSPQKKQAPLKEQGQPAAGGDPGAAGDTQAAALTGKEARKQRRQQKVTQGESSGVPQPKQPQQHGGPQQTKAPQHPKAPQQTPRASSTTSSVPDQRSDADPSLAESKSTSDNRKKPANKGASGAKAAPPGATSPSVAALFAHLQKDSLPASLSVDYSDQVHPAIVKLGILFRKGEIGEDTRCITMLNAFKEFIESYATPPHKALSWDMDRKLRQQIQFLVQCRQHSKSMGNAIKHIRFLISKIPPEMSEADAKRGLCEKIESYIQERIIFARKLISKACVSCIHNGDVIATYGSSAVVQDILLTAFQEGVSFKTIIIDSRPLHEGRKTCLFLAEQGLSCSIAPLSAACVAMKNVSKLFIGASALLSNGAVLSAAGTAMIAAVASYRQVPVIVAAESYKFCDNVQLDCIVYNELADPNEVNQQRPMGGMQGGAFSFNSGAETLPILPDLFGRQEQEEAKAYSVVNLRYDLTPMVNVSMVATEVGLIPPTSVPVLIREFRLEQGTDATNDHQDT